MRRLILVLFVSAVGAPATFPSAGRAQIPRHAILLTLDGVRTEEIFGGLDRAVLVSLQKEGSAEETPTYKQYWAPTPEERREKVIPFSGGP
jgi:hypothetical protein